MVASEMGWESEYMDAKGILNVLVALIIYIIFAVIYFVILALVIRFSVDLVAEGNQILDAGSLAVASAILAAGTIVAGGGLGDLLKDK